MNNPKDTSDPLAELPASSLPEQAQKHEPEGKKSFWRQSALTLGALGVVYGDIGTSPLYALRETVLATGGPTPGSFAIYGALSLIFWLLIFVVTIKYAIFIMRADNDGEGGVMALAALAHRSPRLGRGMKSFIGFSAIMGIALFYGDGMLTPAISVLSAVEGLTVESSAFEPLVLPLTLLILIGLFAMQSKGTAKIGFFFGPVMLIWFSTLAILGLFSIIENPAILYAVNPWYGLRLFIIEPWIAFVALGSVVLAVTGCEALYADMGHFGKKPIRRAWIFFVLPALTLNYFGQGAAILAAPEKAHIAFYSVAPDWAHLPMVILATFATIIASQAVISGVFSMTRQAVQLGQMPRMEIRHTSMTDFGQIYVPRINALLCIGVVLIVLIFKTSGSLAAAYGIAVTGIMLVNTINVGVVATKQWGWHVRTAVLIFGTLGFVDVALLSSNFLKIGHGGWLPLAIAVVVFAVMETWRIGRRLHNERIRNESMPLELFLERADKTPVRVAGTAAFLTARNDIVPGSLLHNLKHNKVLHERVLLVNVIVEDVPIVPIAKRIEVEKLGKGFFNVKIHHGFFETPDIPRALTDGRRFGLAFEPDATTYFIGHEIIVPGDKPVMSHWRMWIYRKLAANALSPARFYHLPPNRVVELGTQVSI